MLLHSCWLLSLLFIASTAANAYRPAVLKPRYLVTGTGILLPSTTPPPYPTGTANKTAISTSVLPTSTLNPTSTPIPPSELFYLVVAAPGTPYDGQYLTIGSNSNGDGELVLYPTDGPDAIIRFSEFNLNADGTLESEFDGGIASIYPGESSYPLVFNLESFVEEEGYTESICEDVDGFLTCLTGVATVFYICPVVFIDGSVINGEVETGAVVRTGCDGIALRIVPV